MGGDLENYAVTLHDVITGRESDFIACDSPKVLVNSSS
jgi:hypothetical protein